MNDEVLHRSPGHHLLIFLGIAILIAWSRVGEAKFSLAKEPGGTGQAVAEDSWLRFCVACPKIFDEITDRSLTLDPDGHPHLVYGGDHLYYARHDGQAWHYHVVDRSPGVGDHPALVLDVDGHPHISYIVNYPDPALNYAYRDAHGWQVETVERAGRFQSATSLDLDSQGYPHISYHFQGFVGDRYLKYAYKDETGWHLTTLNNAGGHASSLALDAGDFPHISAVGDGLHYSHEDANGWFTEQLTPNAGMAATSIAIDPLGYSHISYSNSDGDLSYAYLDEAGWHFQVVDTEGDTTSGSSLALDEHGDPHISYRRASTSYNSDSALKYAYLDVTGWRIQTLREEPQASITATSVALDGDGIIHIFDQERARQGNLTYTRQDATVWHTEPVDDEANIGDYVVLALDSLGNPHIGYFADLPQRELRYSHRDSAGWQTATVDASLDLGGDLSLALDASGSPHMSYRSLYGEALRYAHLSPSGWQIETVDEGAGRIGLTSLALDPEDYPHIVYTYSGQDLTLRYAHLDGTGWHTRTLNFYGWPFDLALDQDGDPHLSLSQTFPDQVQYAYEDETGWHFEVVSEGELSYPGNASLTLDGTGNPAICYRQSGLRYAYRDPTGWQSESVDPIPSVAVRFAMALDQAGYPHIAYDGFGGLLKYAYQDTTGWHMEILSLQEGLIWSPSLALDALDRRHLSYYNPTVGDLLYMYYGPVSERYLPYIAILP